MTDRQRKIRLLLSSLYDGLYFPAGALKTSSGLVPSEKVPCPDCGHTETPGWRTDSFKRRSPCETCGGAKERRAHKVTGEPLDWGARDAGKGFVKVDRMDADRRVVGSADTLATSQPRKTVRCDRCAGAGVWKHERCELCDGTGRRDLHVFDLRLDVSGEADAGPLDSAIDERSRWSYPELDRALADLARANYTARRLVERVFVTKLKREEDLASISRARLEWAMRYLDLRMPHELRVPPGLAANEKLLEEHRTRAKGRAVGRAALARRDKEVRAHVRKGRSAQWVAREYGLHVSTVYEIVNGKREDAA